jgi:hypothetical protein
MGLAAGMAARNEPRLVSAGSGVFSATYFYIVARPTDINVPTNPYFRQGK